MAEHAKFSSSHLLHCYAFGQGSVLFSYLSYCFRIFPLYSVLKTVAMVILWKCFWILSFFCLKASSNFSSWGKCQAPQNQQNVRYSLVLLLPFSPLLWYSASQSPCFSFWLFRCCAPILYVCVLLLTDRKCSPPTPISIACFLSSIKSLFQLGIFREIFCDRL